MRDSRTEHHRRLSVVVETYRCLINAFVYSALGMTVNIYRYLQNIRFLYLVIYLQNEGITK